MLNRGYTMRYSWWLRDITRDVSFCYILGNGNACCDASSSTWPRVSLLKREKRRGCIIASSSFVYLMIQSFSARSLSKNLLTEIREELNS